MRYPRRFEIFRLEPLGPEPQFYDLDEARERYRDDQLITVIPDEVPPSWSLTISRASYIVPGSRFSVTYYGPHKTPVRQVDWEPRADALFCRRIVDLFYPEGDPQRFVPRVHLFSVTQRFGSDGVAEVTLSSPLDDDRYWQRSGVATDHLRLTVPAFGDWEALVAASAPPAEPTRFGLDAIDSALAFAEACAQRGMPVEAADGGWRFPGSDRDVMSIVDTLVAGAEVDARMPVVSRPPAVIIPLVRQADPVATGRDAGEERARVDAFAAEIDAGCEFRGGAGIAFDLTYRGVDRVASYAAALREAGATKAQWWVIEPKGVVIVWSGDEKDGDLSLAVHVVPESWVNVGRTKLSDDRVDLRWSLADLANVER